MKITKAQVKQYTVFFLVYVLVSGPIGAGVDWMCGEKGDFMDLPRNEYQRKGIVDVLILGGVTTLIYAVLTRTKKSKENR